MSEENVKRLQGDLLAIRNAMQLDPPYAPSDVPMHLLMGFSGLVAMVLLEFTSWDRRLCLCLPLVPDMIAYTLRYLKVRQNRERRPVLAREYQIGMVVATVAAVATGGWMWWCRCGRTSR